MMLDVRYVTLGVFLVAELVVYGFLLVQLDDLSQAQEEIPTDIEVLCGVCCVEGGPDSFRPVCVGGWHSHSSVDGQCRLDNACLPIFAGVCAWLRVPTFIIWPLLSLLMYCDRPLLKLGAGKKAI
jgi:hypothetical protein